MSVCVCKWVLVLNLVVDDLNMKAQENDLFLTLVYKTNEKYTVKSGYIGLESDVFVRTPNEFQIVVLEEDSPWF